MAHQAKILRFEKLLIGIAAGVLAAALAFVFAAPAQALAAQDSNALKVGSLEVTTQAAPKMSTDMDLYAGDHEKGLWAYLSNWNYDSQVTKVVSSNAKVLKVKKIDTYKTIDSYDVYPLKAGKAKLTVTYKLKGKTKKISGTFAVKTCPAAIKSMKLNGKALKAPSPKAGHTSDDYYLFKGTSATFDLQLAKGWEAGYISGYFHNPDGGKYKNIDITSGKKFTIPKKYEGSISLLVHNANWEEYFYYTLYIYRYQPLEISKTTYYVGHPKAMMPDFDRISARADKIKIVSVSSSKPSVLKITKGKTYYKVKVQPKKVGKAKLSIKYKFEGKTYTTSAVSNVVKYPLKSVKFNDKSLDLAKYSYGYYNPKYNKAKAKVKFTPISGWKVSKIQFFANGKTKTIKNGATVKLPKKGMSRVLATFKKDKQVFRYWVDLG